MNARLLYHMARADFLERARRYSFLVTVGGAVYFGYLINAGYVNLIVAGERGVLNSAWVGTLTALSLGFLLSWFGFYLVKNTLERDRQTGVGEILAATPLSKVSYTLGKTVSNFLFLSVIVVVLAGAGLLLQLLGGEDRRIDLAAFLAPLLLVALPPLAVTAALAVLFESVRWLRGALGNVLYFILWTVLLATAIQSPVADPLGLNLIKSSLDRAIAAESPTHALPASGQFAFTLGQRYGKLKTFRWEGIEWTVPLVAHRLALLAVAVAVALVAALLFGRFDPAKEGGRGGPRKGESPAAGSLSSSSGENETGGTSEKAGRRRRFRLPAVSPRAPFPALVVAELRLMLKGRSRWWFLVAAGLLAAGLFAPLPAVRAGILPVAWLWPLALWSPMGAREAAAGTRQLVFTGPRPVAYHALAIWTAGAAVAAATAAGAGLRFALAGDGRALLAWVAACLFIPSLALALGSWSGSSKLFEVVYLILWYIGPMNHVPTFDYMGVTPQALAQGMAWVFLAAAAGLLLAAFAGRARQARV
ncbi:MAG TPA: hypothetical protein VOA87_06990 [Thermoanaerobaculia bacterium]|nr:hypothetical protein [Thermoanaerobaculia bacterium]